MSDQLTELLRAKAVQLGTFKLASGRMSDLYVDARQVTLHSTGARLIGERILDRLADGVVAVGGLTMGADPIVSSVSVLSNFRDQKVHGFLIRKQPKGHGAGRVIEGAANLPPGAKVTIVEDTTTTGGSLLRAVERAVEHGLQVVQCITVVDREEGAAEALSAAGYKLEALVTRTDLLRGGHA